MDRALIISYLQAAEHNVTIIEQQIANQRGFISSLRRLGHDTSSASAQLDVLVQTHLQYLGDRDRLRAELAVQTLGTLDQVGELGEGRLSTRCVRQSKAATVIGTTSARARCTANGMRKISCAFGRRHCGATTSGISTPSSRRCVSSRRSSTITAPTSTLEKSPRPQASGHIST